MTTKWLTYAELAEHLGIKTTSAHKRAYKRRWRTQTNNEGVTIVEVPIEVLSERLAKPAPPPPPPPAEKTNAERVAELTATVEGLERVIEAEKRLQEAFKAQAEAHQQRADSAEKDRDEWKARALRPWWQRIRT
jgi:hypothetical protein